MAQPPCSTSIRPLCALGSSFEAASCQLLRGNEERRRRRATGRHLLCRRGPADSLMACELFHRAPLHSPASKALKERGTEMRSAECTELRSCPFARGEAMRKLGRLHVGGTVVIALAGTLACAGQAG